MERMGTTNVGFSVDPQLANPAVAQTILTQIYSAR